jgi:hypothetical protein
MTEYRERSWLTNSDGLRAISVEQGDHTLWRYVEWRWYHPYPENPAVDPTWSPTHWSGFYDSQAEVERGARAALERFG